MKNISTMSARLIVLAVMFLFCASEAAFAQTGVLISASAGTAVPSAMLEVRSSTKGLLLPNVTLGSLTDATSPVNGPTAGLFVYNQGGANPVGLYYWNGATSSWVQLTTGGFSGTGVTNFLARWTTSTNLGTGATYDNGTSVGIGTTTPVAKLELEGTSANWNETTPGVSTGSIHLDPGSSSDHFGSAITWGASDASAGDNAQAGIYIRSDGTYGTKMYLATTDDYAAGSKTRMMIDANGNIGIGTNSPLRRLEVNNALRLTNSSTDANDGVIGSGTFSAGLNIVGINTDGAGRKVSEWGSILQQENLVGNNFTGTTSVATLRFASDASTMSKAPRQVTFWDTRGGCPGAAAAGSNLCGGTITLTGSATVSVDGSIIRNATGRRDLWLVIDGSIVCRWITNTGSTSDWQSGYVQYSGTLAAGNHTVFMQGADANVWGCGADWGRMDIMIYEK